MKIIQEYTRASGIRISEKDGAMRGLRMEVYSMESLILTSLMGKESIRGGTEKFTKVSGPKVKKKVMEFGEALKETVT